jgi:hypothetical protein
MDGRQQNLENGTTKQSSKSTLFQNVMLCFILDCGRVWLSEFCKGFFLKRLACYVKVAR